MSKEEMRMNIIAGLFIGGIFACVIYSIEVRTLSNFFGWLAFSVAAGAMAFIAIFAPYGLRSHTTVFGRRQKYRHPVPEIPGKIAGLILSAVVVCCVISFGLYVYAK